MKSMSRKGLGKGRITMEKLLNRGALDGEKGKRGAGLAGPLMFT